MKCPICETQCKNGRCPACGYRADMGYHDTSQDYWKENAGKYALNDLTDSEDPEQSTEEYLSKVYQKISEEGDDSSKDTLAAELFSGVFHKKQKAEEEEEYPEDGEEVFSTPLEEETDNLINPQEPHPESLPDFPKKTDAFMQTIFPIILLFLFPPACLIYMAHSGKPEEPTLHRILMIISVLSTIAWIISFF